MIFSSKPSDTELNFNLSGELPPSLARWVPSSHHLIVSFIVDAVVQQRWLSAFLIMANIAASLLEGVSIGILYLAINQLFGVQEGVPTDQSGWLTEVTGVLSGAMSPIALFILLIALVAVSQVLQSGFYFLGIWISSVLRMRVRRGLQKRAVAHMMHMSFAQVSRYKAGELWTFITVGRSVEKLIPMINTIAYVSFMALAYLVTLLWLSWETTLLALLMFGILSAGLRPVMKKINDTARRLLDVTLQMNSQVADHLAGMRIIRSYGEERKAQGTIGELIDDSAALTFRGTLWESSVSPLVDVVTILVLALAVGGMALYFGEGMVDVLPRLMVFIFVLYRLMPRLGHLNTVRANLHTSWPIIQTMVDFLHTGDKEMVREGGAPYAGLDGGIEFRDVALRYAVEERPAVSGISFKVEKGQTLAIVGESGAGKSSVVDLLLGLYEPTSGRIFIGGTPLDQLDQSHWRRKLAVVSQEIFLFATSIRENIVFANPDATEEDVIRAAKTAHAHEFVSDLENGYDTLLGDRGFRLSGGQKQRLALARAAIRDPDVLILDEATSDLDSHSEHLIHQALEEFGSGRTMVVIAHRLSTIQRADRILVMSKGKIIESGRHEELLAMNATYASMWALQTGAKVGSQTEGKAGD